MSSTGIQDLRYKLQGLEGQVQSMEFDLNVRIQDLEYRLQKMENLVIDEERLQKARALLDAMTDADADDSLDDLDFESGEDEVY